MSGETKPCRWVAERLDDWLDERLEPAQAVSLEEHLAVCQPCTDEAEALRRLLARTAALPSELPPPGDLWPHIEARLTPPFRAPASRRLWVPAPALRLAASWLLVAAMGAGAAWWWSRPAPEAASPLLAAAPGDSLEALERTYREARQELMAGLAPAGSGEGSEARLVIERNLEVIGQALAEIRSALATNPNDEQLRRLLRMAYAQELDLLRRAHRLESRKS